MNLLIEWKYDAMNFVCKHRMPEMSVRSNDIELSCNNGNITFLSDRTNGNMWCEFELIWIITNSLLSFGTIRIMRMRRDITYDNEFKRKRCAN